MTDAPPAIAALVLAAGQGTRFRAQSQGALKLLALDRGEPLVRHVARAALASRARPVRVVTGHAREAVRACLADLDVAEVHNPDFASGLSTSLRAGLADLPASVEGALVLLGDMPRVSADLLDRLMAAFAGDTQVAAVVPTLAGRRGNPVLLARRLFADVATLMGDEGARRLLRATDQVVELPVDDDAITIDIDTPAALEALRLSRRDV